MNENIVEPILPYWLRLDQVKGLLQKEMDEPLLVPPIHQYALEISEYFFELPSLGPWSTYVELAKKENERAANANSNTSQSTQSTDIMGATQLGPNVETGASHVADDRKKYLKVSTSIRRKVLDVYQSWLKQRRIKIFKLLEMNGALCSTNLFSDGSHQPKIISTLYQREHRWISPIGKDYISRLKLGSYGVRSCNVSTVLCSMGLDFPGFLEKEEEIQQEFINIFVENYQSMKENCHSAASQMTIDYINQEATENPDEEQ